MRSLSRQFALPALAALLSLPAFAQTTAATKPAMFEAADVQISRHSGYHMAISGSLSGNRYRFQDATLVAIIASAYNVEPDRVVEGPSWLELDHFNIVAQVPPATSPDTLRLMLRSLLADRFGLVAHTDVKPLPAFVLTTGSDPPKLKPADSEGPSGCEGNQGLSAPPNFVFSCHNMTAADLAIFLYNLNRPKDPVLDATGLKGAWNFDIKWNPYLMGTSQGEIAVIDIAEKQLGLKLEAKLAPQPVVIVETANRLPTPDPPGTADALPHAPTEFEVAVIKPSKPDTRSNGIVPRGSELDARGLNMYQLIIYGWDFNYLNFNGLANTPKWFDIERFDILAKLPAMPGGVAVDSEDLRPMIRSLLEERFKLKTHTEVRPALAYVLTALVPKLKKADPASRSTCREGPGPAGKDAASSMPLRSLICRNITMAQFAVQMMNFEPSSVGDASVIDETGIQGGYDFTVTYNLPQALRQPQAPSGETPMSAEAPEPTGILSFFDALKQQLGLKLEKQNRPVPMLVIDHVERTPTEN